MPKPKIADVVKLRHKKKSKPSLNDQEAPVVLMRVFKRFLFAVSDAEDGIADILQRTGKTKAQLVALLHTDFQSEATNLIATIVNLDEVHKGSDEVKDAQGE